MDKDICDKKGKGTGMPFV